jgi:ABC-type hemin transport system substrate-binding protein
VGGRNTFIDDLFALTGAANSVDGNGWPQLSLERLIATPPDLVLYPGGTVSRASLERLFQAQPELLARVQLVPVDDNLFTRPGPRVAEAAAALNGIFDRWEASH